MEYILYAYALSVLFINCIHSLSGTPVLSQSIKLYSPEDLVCPEKPVTVTCAVIFRDGGVTYWKSDCYTGVTQYGSSIDIPSEAENGTRFNSTVDATNYYAILNNKTDVADGLKVISTFYIEKPIEGQCTIYCESSDGPVMNATFGNMYTRV